MTTVAKKRYAKKKTLRIRGELLPESAKYAMIDDIEHVMIPVADFGEWYEDVEDGAVVQHARDNPVPLVPAARVREKITPRSRGAKR